MLNNIQSVVFVISKLGNKNYVSQIVGNKADVTNKTFPCSFPTLATNAYRHLWNQEV